MTNSSVSLHLRPSRLICWRYARWALLAPVVPALWACSSHPLEAPTPCPDQQTEKYLELNPKRDVDILFMIDNSNSMKEEQVSLAANFPVFMDELKKIPGGLPNVQIGIVSSDMGAGGVDKNGNPTPTPCTAGGDAGRFLPKAGCGLNDPYHWLTSIDKGTKNNFTGDIGTVFSCLADLGTKGCGLEHQLQSIRVALAAIPGVNETTNKGFLRTDKDAYLGIILITDEDDCSAPQDTDLFTMPDGAQQWSLRCALKGHTCGGAEPMAQDGYTAPLASCASNEKGKLIPVSEFVSFVKGLKSREDHIIVSAITGINNDANAQYKIGLVDELTTAGTPTGKKLLDYLPTCESANGKATAAIRVKEFVNAFGGNGSVHSLCAGDLRPAMKRIGEIFAEKLRDTCIGAPLVDIDTVKADLQPDCVVVDRKFQGTGGHIDAPLPKCAQGGAMPCWNLVASPLCSVSGYKIEVDRGGAVPPPSTEQIIKCRTTGTSPTGAATCGNTAAAATP